MSTTRAGIADSLHIAHTHTGHKHCTNAHIWRVNVAYISEISTNLVTNVARPASELPVPLRVFSDVVIHIRWVRFNRLSLYFGILLEISPLNNIK